MSSEAVLAAVRDTALRHRLFTEAAAAHLGIGPTDLDCLLVLRDLGPASAGQLAEVLGLTTGAITGVVDRLAAAGFVVRESDPSDRRRVIVQPLTEQLGRLDDVVQPLLSGMAQALQALTREDLSQLLEFERRTSAVLEQATARLKAEQTVSSAATTFSAPLGGLETACLEFAAGASNVRVLAAAERSDELYSATFEGVQPGVRVQAGVVSVRYRRMGLLEWGTARHAGTVTLNPGVPWSLALHGGASAADIDLRGIELCEFALDGGASKVQLLLPAARGSVSVCLVGGANRVQIQRPAGVPVELQVRGGANRLEFDGQRFGAVGGDLRLASPGWELASDRYVVEVRGGASRLRVQEFQAPQEVCRSC
jgi:DNA-binding MarR family transcriptional regulator